MQKKVIVLPWRRGRNRMKPNLVFFGSRSGSLDRAVALEIWGKLRHMFYDELFTLHSHFLCPIKSPFQKEYRPSFGGFCLGFFGGGCFVFFFWVVMSKERSNSPDCQGSPTQLPQHRPASPLSTSFLCRWSCNTAGLQKRMLLSHVLQRETRSRRTITPTHKTRGNPLLTGDHPVKMRMSGDLWLAALNPPPPTKETQQTAKLEADTRGSWHWQHLKYSGRDGKTLSCCPH